MSRGLATLIAIPAILLALAGVAIYLTEDDSPARLAATIGGGLAISGALWALVAGVRWSVGRAEADGQRRASRPGRAGRPPGWFPGWVGLALVGVGLAVAGALLVHSTWRFSQEAETTVARVVSTSERGSGEPRTYAEVEFEVPADGEGTDGARLVEAEVGPLPSSDLGESEIEVRYDPDDPDGARTAFARGDWFASLALLAGGLALAIPCAIGAWRRRP